MSEPEELQDAWLRAAFGRYEDALLAYAARMVGGDRARDVVQETFLSLCASPRAEIEERLGAWLFTVCRNRALDVLRKEGRMRPLEGLAATSPEPAPAEILDLRRRTDRVLEALAALPPKQREVIELKLGQGLSYREISEVTGLSVSNVGYLIHVGLKSVRAEIERRERGR